MCVLVIVIFFLVVKVYFCVDVEREKVYESQSQDRNVIIFLIGYESFELVLVLVFFFKSLDFKDFIEFFF